ncbi:MAG TPA: replication-associated recombination protein A, partial [Chthoniobacteraceae bacterium]|nr:replication-associated recombination protein A [Chthoniobacteraceae bacterium]
SATASRFERLSGVESNVADLRRVIAAASNRLANKGDKTILFIDEIHRWNKALQDVLLPDVERGTVRLIGATTHNPFFYINSPLVSRSQVFQLEPLQPAHLIAVMKRALADTERGLGKYNVAIDDDALQHLATTADGDARKCLNALEIGVLTTPAILEGTADGAEGRTTDGTDHTDEGRGGKSSVKSAPSEVPKKSVSPAIVAGTADGAEEKTTDDTDEGRGGKSSVKSVPSVVPKASASSAAPVIRFTKQIAEESIQKKAVVYDADGDQHYDTISAFIKSIRGSDPDAALYWLAKMLYAGEDIRFIARRLVIAASEDIGMADPQGLVVAVAAQQSVEFIGLPEAQIPLAHATVYLATAPKSNRAYAGILAAKKEVQEGVTLAVPRHLRSTGHKKGAKALGHEGYRYSHDFEGAYVPQAYLPEGRRYYDPSEQGYEKRVKERLDFWRARFEEAQAERGQESGSRSQQ